MEMRACVVQDLGIVPNCLLSILSNTCKDVSLQQGNIGPCKEFTRKGNAQGNDQPRISQRKILGTRLRNDKEKYKN